MTRTPESSSSTGISIVMATAGKPCGRLLEGGEGWPLYLQRYKELLDLGIS